MERDGKKNQEGCISIEDLSEQHQQYAEVIGVENLLLLSRYFGGSSFYVPKIDELLKNQKYAQILQEFDGGNVKQLAAKYRVSESTVYRLVRHKRKVIARNPLAGQLKLF